MSTTPPTKSDVEGEGDNTRFASISPNAEHEQQSHEAAKSTGRNPDAQVRIRNVSVSGWFDKNRGWNFRLSRGYREQGGSTAYSEMTLFDGDLLNAAACLQRMAEHVMQVRISEPF